MILDSAHNAFATRPFDEVQVADIASEHGISVGLIHKYFGSKHGLFLAVRAEWLADIRDAQQCRIDEVPAGAPKRDLVVAFVGAFIDAVANLNRPEQARHVLAALAEGGQPWRWGVDKLADIVQPNATVRDHFALVAAVGAARTCAQDWVVRGCPAAERDSLVQVIVDSLQGALGDWHR